ncbi:hypothetical protein H8S75_22315 [Hungatella sp. L12]|uniref:DUF6128 domain-containing protein n=1 Tax=Hungatella hominis TaxID=2763050 RepID=A0ABR7HC35_9FIRM|nr:DUF6128 domain-containing protein [Hungatella hominis]MBC5710685.1 hypothetical protein [Hungatella hominis]
MSNYRRLISYIYAYEGGIKGKNIGFAKIETRGSQCKITVNVKKVYVGGNDIGVYLLAGEKEILLGNIFIRGGSGEFRTVVSVSDVEHSGIPMDQCYGLTVHDVENTWRSYTTIWEDAVAHAAEVELSNTLPEKKEREETAQEAQIKKAMKEIEEEFPVEAVQETKEIEKQDKMSREQLKAFTESAREQSKAFAESIRKQVEQSADTTEQTAEAWIRQQEARMEWSRAKASYIESMNEPAKPEMVPVEEPVSDLHSTEEPAADKDTPIREPYRQQQEPMKMAHADEGSYRKQGNSARSYTSFSGIPAVEYAAELMPDIETVTTLHTGIMESDTEESYYIEEKNQAPFMAEGQCDTDPEEMLYNVEETGTRSEFLEDIQGETICYRADTSGSFVSRPESGSYPQQLEKMENSERLAEEMRMNEPELSAPESIKSEVYAPELREAEMAVPENGPDQISGYTSQYASEYAQQGPDMYGGQDTYETSGIHSASDIYGIPGAYAMENTQNSVISGTMTGTQNISSSHTEESMQEISETYSTDGNDDISEMTSKDAVQSSSEAAAPKGMRGYPVNRPVESMWYSSDMRQAGDTHDSLKMSASENYTAKSCMAEPIQESGEPEEPAAVRGENPDSYTSKSAAFSASKPSPLTTSKPSPETIPENVESHRTDEVSGAGLAHTVDEEPKAPELQKAQKPQPVPGNPMELERLLKTEEEDEDSSERVWENLRRDHTKILDFDYEKGCEILTIKPQDIGLLPREIWVYGNNSFLLHGYYNYRYLILAKLFNPEGTPRYLLGVPGHYYSNERYMASMFGFPNFVLSKNQPIEDGRFGYWYTDVKIGS